MAELLICRCEELTLDELEGAIRTWGITSLTELKLITRAGKGACQGRTCSHLMARLLAHASNQSLAELTPWRARIPVRPVPAVALSRGEGPEPTAAVTLTMMDISNEERHLQTKGE